MSAIPASRGRQTGRMEVTRQPQQASAATIALARLER
jgi:hypothetical protein